MYSYFDRIPKLWDRGRVVALDPLDYAFDGEDVVLFRIFEGTGFSNQVDGRSDGR